MSLSAGPPTGPGDAEFVQALAAMLAPVAAPTGPLSAAAGGTGAVPDLAPAAAPDPDPPRREQGHPTLPEPTAPLMLAALAAAAGLAVPPALPPPAPGVPAPTDVPPEVSAGAGRPPVQPAPPRTAALPAPAPADLAPDPAAPAPAPPAWLPRLTVTDDRRPGSRVPAAPAAPDPGSAPGPADATAPPPDPIVAPGLPLWSASAAPPPADPARALLGPGVPGGHGLANQIAYACRYAGLRTDGTGRSEFRVELVPEHLGEVSLKLVVQDGQVRADLVVARPEVKAALDSEMGFLRQRLQQQGLELGALTVAVGQGGARGDPQGSPRRWPAPGWRRPMATGPVAAADPEGPAVPAAVQAYSAWRIGRRFSAIF